MNYKMDENDLKIIRLLKKNGRMRNTEIAKKVNLSEATVRNRLKRLFEEEFIQVVAILNHAKMGYGISGNIRFKVDLKKADQVIEELKNIDCLEYIARTVGAWDIEADYFVKNTYDLNRLISNQLSKIDGITSMESAVIIQYVRDNYNWGVIQKQDVLYGS